MDILVRDSTEYRLGLQEQNRTSKLGGERVEVLAKETKEAGTQLPGEGEVPGHPECVAVGGGVERSRLGASQ